MRTRYTLASSSIAHEEADHRTVYFDNQESYPSEERSDTYLATDVRQRQLVPRHAASFLI